MKKRIIISLLVSIILILTIFAGFVLANDIRVISVEKAYLKEKPQNFSNTVATLEANDAVEILEELDNWFYVETVDEGYIGYIQTSAVSTEVVSADVNDSTVVGEGATAGARGFNEDTEEEFKDTSDYDFDAVDRAESLTEEFVKDPMKDFMKFREEGSLGEYQK